MKAAIRTIIALGALSCALVFGPSPGQARAPDTWDGLFRVRSSKLDAAYILPGADFRIYNQVMIDPPQIAFKKDWLRDMNIRGHRVGDADLRRAIDRGSAEFLKALTEAYTAAGYSIATAPAPEVLRVSTAIVDLAVSAPDTMPAGRSVVFASDAGQATLVLEARDSLSGSLLGRAVDGAAIGDNRPYLRNTVTNWGDFEMQFRDWAKASARGLNTLKANSPVDADGVLRK
jgi:hypothetical protein